MNYFEILLERKKEKDDVIKNLEKYLEKIKTFVKQKYPEAKILLFGSFIKDEFKPNSDIDVLVVLPQIDSDENRHHFNYEVRKQIEFNPFIEIHIVSEQEYNSWWSKFIKNNYKVVI